MANNIREKINEDYKSKRKLSLELNQRAAKFMPGGDTRTATFFKPYPHFIEKGEGCFIWDVDGNRLIDFQNNYTSLIHGHAHKETREAVCEQIALGSAYSAPIPLQIALSEIICDRVPSIDLVRFTNSGTEATMHAVRCARAYTGRTKILKIEGGYHGTSDIFEASVDPDLEIAGAIDRPRPVPDSKGVPQSSLDEVVVAPFNDIKATQQIIESEHLNLCAFIIEPIMGSAGMIEPGPDYLRFIRDITEKYGIVLIFDEVVTFRLAYGGIQETYAITPDITVLGKIIGGGIPIGAFGGKAGIMEMYDPRSKTMYHSGTFNGNAIAMAAGTAAMKSYSKNDIERINSLGDIFRSGCRDIFSLAGLDIQITGTGSLCNIIFSNKLITEYRGVAASYEEFNVLLNLSLINKGVFNAPRGMFCISTVMSEKIVAEALNVIKEALLEIAPLIREEAPELIL